MNLERERECHVFAEAIATSSVRGGANLRDGTRKHHLRNGRYKKKMKETGVSPARVSRRDE